MRRSTRRALWTALALVIVIAVIGAIFLLRKRAAPEAVRLLPEAQGYLYINLRPLRHAGVLNDIAPITGEPEYKDFVAQTGFQVEKDLDEAAFAIHPPSTPTGETRYSEIFIGRINTDRASKYFAHISRFMERYRELEIYNIPVEGRTVRVTLLGPNMAAVSNTESPEVIHGMIDRYKQLARPFGGPMLVREYYKHRPLGSMMWTILRVAPDTAPTSPGERPRNMFILPGGYDLFFPPGTVIVGSVRYTGSVDVKAEAFTTGEDAARRITEQLGAFLSLFRTIETSTQPSGPDKDVKAFFDSLKIEQEGSHATLTANVPPGFLKKALSEPPASELPGVGGKQAKQPPKKQEVPAPKKRKSKR
jgi:hypothetical protein